MENVQEFAYFYGDYSELTREFDSLLEQEQEQEKLTCQEQTEVV